jgi:hypothetical protein
LPWRCHGENMGDSLRGVPHKSMVNDGEWWWMMVNDSEWWWIIWFIVVGDDWWWDFMAYNHRWRAGKIIRNSTVNSPEKRHVEPEGICVHVVPQT